MKSLSRLSLLAVFLAPAVYTLPMADSPHVELLADKVVRTDHMLRGSGHARAKIDGLAIQADEGTWNSDTGQLEMRGHVQLALPEREDHMVFRYGTGNLLTDKAVSLHADRLTVESGMLEAWDNLVIRPVDPDDAGGPILQAAHMLLFLKTGDATVRGNIRTTNLEPVSTPVRPLFPRYPLVFPPEIIK